ncbi:MAG TPA: hypothetical protein VIV60_12095 [Polyangiaceae bacterium]
MALATAALEVTTHVGAVFVNPAGVLIGFTSVKNACTTVAHLECLVSEVTRLELLDDIQPLSIPPALDVTFRHENGAPALKATRSAFETVELGVVGRHQFTSFDRSRIYAIW